MKAKRRGFLGGMLLSPFAAKSAAHEVARAPGARLGETLVGTVPEESVWSREARAAGVDISEHFDRLQKAMRPHRERHHRVMMAVDRSGGIPFHLASMRSCAPWFIHQRAELWRAQQQEELRSWHEKLHDEIVGKIKGAIGLRAGGALNVGSALRKNDY